MRRLLFATVAIVFASVAAFPQQKSDRESAGINDHVRTVRMEGRQLSAVTGVQSGVMVYTMIYDDKGRLLERAEYLPGGNPDTKSTSAYDARGNEIEHASYIHDELSHRSTTRYDARNRKIEQLSFNSSGKQDGKFIFQYDKRGRQIRLEVQPGGKTRKRSVAVLDRRCNEIEREEYDESGATESRYVYTYDPAGNKTSEVHYYKQNGSNRMTKSTYVYDQLGSLIEKVLYFDGVLDNKTTYKRDGRGNQIESVEIDGKGQLKEKRIFSYEFDSENNWTRAEITEWTSKAPNAPRQPAYEYRRIFGSVNDATIALWSAAREGDAARVRVLIQQGADVNASHPDGGSPLIKAAARGNRNVVQALLAADAHVDGKDAEGWTALMWAAEYGRIDVVRILLEAAANPNAATLDGSTALMVSTQAGQAEAIKLLLAKGADPNAKTKHGLTALFFAAKSSNIDSLKAILDAGVDVNARAKNGTTPLMFAAAQLDTAGLQFLIERGAHVNVKTDDGTTALSIAVQANNDKGAELLRKAGAK